MIRRTRGWGRSSILVAALSFMCLAACGHSSSTAGVAQGPSAPQAATFPPAPAPETTGGFDGARAYKHVQQLVAIGPHPAGGDGIRRAQTYIIEQLKGFGCPVEEQDFHASTPIGDVAMKNILVKIPSANPNIILYASHYDTKRIDKFVGADDGGVNSGGFVGAGGVCCAAQE